MASVASFCCLPQGLAVKHSTTQSSCHVDKVAALQRASQYTHRLSPTTAHLANADQAARIEPSQRHSNHNSQALVSSRDGGFTTVAAFSAFASLLLASPSLASPILQTHFFASEQAFVNASPTRNATLASLLPVEFVLIDGAAPELSADGETRPGGQGVSPIDSARIGIESVSSPAAQQQSAYAAAPAENAREVFARKVSGAVEMLEGAKQLQAEGDFQGALAGYTRLVELHGDLALADYARVGRALMLYEEGERLDAIYEMEDMSIGFKGYPEVHAALAAALYTDKHLPMQAERQFSFATLLDPRYTSLDYVKSEKHWPPSLVASLKTFLTLG